MAITLTSGGAEFRIYCIHREIFSVNMPGNIQVQISEIVTSSVIVYCA